MTRRPAKPAEAGLEVVEDVLTYAMENNNIGAAVSAVRILGERGSIEEQIGSDPAGTPLVQAVKHDDPRCVFAAVEAVLQT